MAEVLFDCYRVAVYYPNLKTRVVVEVPSDDPVPDASRCAEWAWKQEGVYEVIRDGARVLIMMKADPTV